MTIEEIRAAIARATTSEERDALLDQLQTATREALNGPTQLSPLDQARAGLVTATSERDRLMTEIEQITTGAVDDGGNAREYTIQEAEQRGRLLAQLDQARAAHREREDEVRQLEHDGRESRALDAIAQLRRDLGLADQSASNGLSGITVGRESRTYEKGNGFSYLQDMVARSIGAGIGARWSRACERLAQHAVENHIEALEVESKANTARSRHEEYFLRQMIECRNDRELDAGPIARRAMSYRALSTASTAGGEFTPPMYLTADWIAYARPGRVLADCQHHEQLPDGTMSINIPKVSGGASVGTQGSQNTNVSNTDMQTQFVTFPVVTKAGMQLVSLQLLERSPISFDEVVGRDLMKAYAANLDAGVANGPGGSADILGILNTTGVNTVTWTQGSPTVKGLYGQVATGKVDVANALFLPATHQVMTPNCWEWIGQTFDTQNRPLVVPDYNGPFNTVAVPADAATAEGVVGRRMNGLSTFEDYNLPNNLGSGSNQDVILGGAFDENWLYESPITTRMLPQTYGAQLSMLLQIYGYVAFTAARYPTANFVVTGTGMASSNRTFNS